MLDGAGKAIPGYAAGECQPIRADAVDIPVQWQEKTTLEGLAGKPVRLKFHLKRTKLFSFWID